MTTGKNFFELLGENDPPPRPTLVRVVPPTGSSDVTRDTKYAMAALDDECNTIANTPPKTRRNEALNEAAFSIARFVNEGLLSADYVKSRLAAAARQAGLPDAEIDTCLRGDRHQRDAAAKMPGPAVPPPTIAKTNGHTPEVSPTRTPTLGIPAEDEVFGVTDDEGFHPIWGSHQPIDGAAYLFDHDDTATALWGHDEHILWAEGEALMIAGGMGLGKTTLAGQIVRAQLGLDTECLGLPVVPADGPILYLAMDRPRQIRRSMLRQFDRAERDAIAGRLLIRPGPPLADLAVRPTLLAEMAAECGATVVYIDSLKDAAVGLSGDEVGAAYNRSRQYALASGVQVCELHHLIKRNPMGGAPNSVADVYGSNWLTAGAGSVIMLTGDPGDPIVEFRHAKQPHTEVGPYRLLHDQTAGRFSIDHEVDLLALAAACGANGLTPHGAAAAVFEKEKPTRAQVEKARRRLDKLVTSGHLICVEGIKGGVAGGQSANYFLAK